MAARPVLRRGLARLHPDPPHPARRRRFRRPDLRPLGPTSSPSGGGSTPTSCPSIPTLFGEKEGKIARANRGRDPLYLFSALQRQLGYPEVPRPAGPTSPRPASLCSSRRSPSSRTGSRPPRATCSHDVDLAQVMVKPEDTAGVPSGWGTEGEWIVSAVAVRQSQSSTIRSNHGGSPSMKARHDLASRSVVLLAAGRCLRLLPHCRLPSSSGSSSTPTSRAATRSRWPTSTATRSPTSSPWAAAPAPGTRTRRGRSGS